MYDGGDIEEPVNTTGMNELERELVMFEQAEQREIEKQRYVLLFYWRNLYFSAEIAKKLKNSKGKAKGKGKKVLSDDEKQFSSSSSSELSESESDGAF